MLSKWNEPGLNKRIFLSELKNYTLIMEDMLTKELYPKEHLMKVIGFTQFIDKLSGTI
jgi:hypothetical protein